MSIHKPLAKHGVLFYQLYDVFKLLPLMLAFENILVELGLDLTDCLIVRHAPVESSLKRVLPWMVAERPDLWLAYQQIQWSTLEKAMCRANTIASFIGHKPKRAAFASLYRIGGSRKLDYEGYCRFPGNAELEGLGMSPRDPDMEPCLAFDLEPLGDFDDYAGRLTIRWPMPHQQWWRWAANGSFPIDTIERESTFLPSMPDWRELVVSWHELHSLPATWREKLSQWRGIYFIHEGQSGKGYVGSAYGGDNILGRWLAYARTGHGGNVGLATSDAKDFRFSILQRTSPDLEADEVIALESSWKKRLHTREFGMNLN